MLGLACKGPAIWEINKRTMKIDIVRKLVWTNYLTNVYKKWDCPGSVAKKEKLQSVHFLQSVRKSENITSFFRPDALGGSDVNPQHMFVWRQKRIVDPDWNCLGD